MVLSKGDNLSIDYGHRKTVHSADCNTSTRGSDTDSSYFFPDKYKATAYKVWTVTFGLKTH